MGFVSSLLSIVGFGFGLLLGLLFGFLLFVYSHPHKHEKDLKVRPLHQLDTNALHDILTEIPFWVKCPDYERVDWLNNFLLQMWPYLDKAVCASIRSIAQPIFAEYIGMYNIEAIEFEHLTLGNLPPTVHGLKVYETNERDLVMEPAIKWASNANIILVLKSFSLRVTVQLVDLQIFAAPRIALKPLVPTFPCFASIVVSLMERPHVDFGLKILSGDVMSIPGLYRFIQEFIKKQVAFRYLWPQTLDIPVLDASTVSVKKPVGILHVKVVRAMKLLKADLLGKSDPYVKLKLTGEKLSSKKTTIKKNTLNPEWNENFKLIVKDPESQVLQLQVFDWDKVLQIKDWMHLSYTVGGHDRLGMQAVPLKVLTPHETKEFVLDVLKHTNVGDHNDKKQRGQLVLEMTFVPFREDSTKSLEHPNGHSRKESGSGSDSSFDDKTLDGAGLLSVLVQGAEDVEGKHHNNPYALVLFRGERRKTKMMRRTRDPHWDEEFQFTLDHPPFREKIRIEIMSKHTRFSFRSKESLGHVDINLDDVVYNGRINNKYNLIDSKNGMLHVEIRWDTV